MALNPTDTSFTVNTYHSNLINLDTTSRKVVLITDAVYDNSDIESPEKNTVFSTLQAQLKTDNNAPNYCVNLCKCFNNLQKCSLSGSDSFHFTFSIDKKNKDLMSLKLSINNQIIYCTSTSFNSKQ